MSEPRHGARVGENDAGARRCLCGRIGPPGASDQKFTMSYH